MFTKCSLSGTSQLSFCDTPLLFRPHLNHQTTRAGCPCGFLQHGAFCGAHSPQQGFSTAVRIRISRRIESIAAAHVVRQPREVFTPIPPHHISGYNNSEYNNFGEYNKRPRIFRYGVFLKNKPAMTYSPTPTKVQYHRRKES